jgi:hypothetical protein
MERLLTIPLRRAASIRDVGTAFGRYGTGLKALR